ncbi:MAG: hypothetical protein ACM3SS_05430 [Rhodospirillaceae bacterium]
MEQRNSRVGSCTKLAAVGAALWMLYAASAPISRAEEWTSPYEPPSGSERIALLEQAFWRCDYVATTHGVDATPIAACSASYVALRDEKFSGSFHDLLAWWSANKEREHRKLSTEAPATY